MESKYYIGLDMGTNSVGYAVTDEEYKLLKFKGEPMWGSAVFDSAQDSSKRRAFRTQRRRLDRKKQRVLLLQELFAEEISKKDAGFFIRLKESGLYRQPGEKPFSFFETMAEQKAFYKEYPTIHHLITAFWGNTPPDDIRLLYLACSWLVTHRGHFLCEVSKDKIGDVLDFSSVYKKLTDFLTEDNAALPWDSKKGETVLKQALKERIGKSAKYGRIKEELFDGRKIPKADDDSGAYSVDGIISLLCGKKYALSKLFGKSEYQESGSFSLDTDDDTLAAVLAELEDDEKELILNLKAIYDWSVLVNVLNGKKSISEAKVETYEQHKRDLAFLKKFIRKYAPEKYDEIFKAIDKKDNYTAYSYHVTSKKGTSQIKNRADKETFSKYLRGILNNITPDENDREEYEIMLVRLSDDLLSFLPKQKDTNNRVIPYQLYWDELNRILINSQKNFPFLLQKDADGLSVKEKILSVFEFRIPYFVGPLCTYKSSNAWIVRKGEGHIYPWNFNKLVDLNESEQAFIRRMTNTCTYMPGEDVLPKNSLIYCAFTVLNEINNLKADGIPISVEAKQGIFTDLFLKYRSVTPKRIKDYLVSKNYISKTDEISGIDEKIKASMKPYLSFKRLIDNGALTAGDVEKIITRASYSEDKIRFSAWLNKNYPALNDADRKYVSSLDFKKFGRLSKAFLCELEGVDTFEGSGEVISVMDALWRTNCNLNQLLTDRFTFKKQLKDKRREYFSEKHVSISEWLNERYISGSVKRPIIRTLDIVKDIVKTLKRPPEKIFIEMSRGGDKNQKGKRTETRLEQLKKLYGKIKSDETAQLNKMLSEMGDSANNKLQSNKLFLYFMQLGKCLYTGQSIDITRLTAGEYNIEHIYPQCFVKDDSIINNEILVDSNANGLQKDIYPVLPAFRAKMTPYWTYLNKNGLMSDEKFRRLTRSSGFTDEEKQNFIARQLVETRQSTKAVTELLNELYPDSKIIYVKAGLVSEFRQDFDMVKSRSINDLHHAKDAYLNIVVGNVYDCRFNRKWFNIQGSYSVNLKAVFTHEVRDGSRIVWQGGNSIAPVRRIVEKNNVHYTCYPFCAHGELFDQTLQKAAEGLAPLKKGMPTEIYGGYTKTAAAFFVLAKFEAVKKTAAKEITQTDIMIMPVELMIADKFLADDIFAENYAKETIGRIKKRQIRHVCFLLNKRIIKIKTMFSLDGFRVCLSRKSSGGKEIGIVPMMPFAAGRETEKYIKKLESFSDKKGKNNAVMPDAEFDGITSEKNIELYELYVEKFGRFPYSKRPGGSKSKRPGGSHIENTLQSGKDKFAELDVSTQVKVLLNIHGLFGRANSADLKDIGGKGSTGVPVMSAFISNWKNHYSDVRIIDQSASGLHEKVSENILEML